MTKKQIIYLIGRLNEKNQSSTWQITREKYQDRDLKKMKAAQLKAVFGYYYTDLHKKYVEDQLKVVFGRYYIEDEEATNEN